MSKLSVDCLNEIIEYLEDDKTALHSCLLVNRLWCKVFVRILWTNVWNYDTLISCLPDESVSKKILSTSGIINSKPPLFNYVTFIKNVEIDKIIENILKIYQPLKYKMFIVAPEICELFINQIPSLKELHFDSSSITCISSAKFARAKGCLANLSNLSFCSNICPELLYQL